MKKRLKMFKKQTYIQRRNKLQELVSDGIILIVGHSNVPINYFDNSYELRQDSSFLYYFGLNRANCVGLIDIANNQEYLFADNITEEDEIWMWKELSIQDLAEKVGIKNIKSLLELKSFLEQYKREKIHFFPPYRAETKILLANILDRKIEEVGNGASVKLIKASIKLRSIKSEEEIEEIEKAMGVGYLMHTTAMKMTKVGLSEQEIVGRIEGIAISFANGIEALTILSQNGEILHNHNHEQILEDGRLLLIDAGAETIMGYCSDNTRTFPVNGKFTKKQKDIYNICLEANIRAIEQIKIGVKYRDIHFMAVKIILDGLKRVGIVKGDTEQALKDGVHTLFMPHGLGHMMGLDVHDMESYGEDFVGYDDVTTRSQEFGTSYIRLAKELQEGFVLTVEPGIYFIPKLIEKFENEGKFRESVNYALLKSDYLDFGGVRIEDNVVVTKEGCRVLGKEIPKSIDEIEAIMKRDDYE